MNCDNCGQPILPTRLLMLLSPDGEVIRLCSWPCVVDVGGDRTEAGGDAPFPHRDGGTSGCHQSGGGSVGDQENDGRHLTEAVSA